MACVTATVDPGPTVSLPGTSLALPAEIRADLVSCCTAARVGSIRLRIARVSAGPVSAPPTWTEPARNASRLAATLHQHRQEAILYRRLAILNRDADIVAVTPTLDDLQWRGVPRDRFIALCDELGFDTVRERVHRWAD